jgi:hypothetical protein
MPDKTPLPFALQERPHPSERRGETRYPCSLEVSCQPITAKGCDLWWLAELKDVSRSGVGMVSTRQFDRGVYIAVQLVNLATRFGQTRIARVMHVAPTGGKWFLGCLLQSPFDEEDLRLLIPPTAKVRVK